jgi:hypothetical protein
VFEAEQSRDLDVAYDTGLLDVRADEEDSAGQTGVEGFLQASCCVPGGQVGDVMPHWHACGAQSPGKGSGQITAIGSAVAEENRRERTDTAR